MPKVKLTSSMLDTFIGGQLEIQNPEEGYLYRGEIKTAEVVDDEVHITLNWMAKGELPPIAPAWVVDETLEYKASLVIYDDSIIGPSAEGGGLRLCLHCAINGETAVLYPRDGSKLDPARVRGLNVPTAK